MERVGTPKGIDLQLRLDCQVPPHLCIFLTNSPLESLVSTPTLRVLWPLPLPLAFLLITLFFTFHGSSQSPQEPSTGLRPLMASTYTLLLSPTPHPHLLGNLKVSHCIQ